jgi:GNAT superfamily N-acetyltransferase
MTGEGITTYFEMRQRPTLQVTPPHRSGMLLRLGEPTVSFYRYLCAETGRPIAEEDEVIAERLTDPLVEIFVLSMEGTPAGWFELDRSSPDEVALSGYGIVTHFAERGLERYLLAAAVEAAWDQEPSRVWVRAEAGGDPRRLLDYQWAGFVPYDVRRDD